MILKLQLYIHSNAQLNQSNVHFFLNQDDNNGALKNTNINDISSVC